MLSYFVCWGVLRSARVLAQARGVGSRRRVRGGGGGGGSGSGKWRAASGRGHGEQQVAVPASGMGTHPEMRGAEGGESTGGARRTGLGREMCGGTDDEGGAAGATAAAAGRHKGCTSNRRVTGSCSWVQGVHLVVTCTVVDPLSRACNISTIAKEGLRLAGRVWRCGSDVPRLQMRLLAPLRLGLGVRGVCCTRRCLDVRARCAGRLVCE